MSDPWDKPFDASVFDDAATRDRINAAAEGEAVPGFPWNHPAVKFAKWYIDKFGHGGPKGSDSWIDEGANYRADKDYAQSGGDNTNIENDDSVLNQYETDTSTNTNNQNNQNNQDDQDNQDDQNNNQDDQNNNQDDQNNNQDGEIEEITVTANGNLTGLPLGVVGAVAVTALGNLIWHPGEAGDSGFWENESTGDTYSPDGKKIQSIGATGTQPDSMWSEIDWSSISDWGGLASILSTLGISLPNLDWEGLGGGDEDEEGGGEDDEELSWWEKLFEIVKSKKAIDDYNKYQVPTSQMDAQSAIGKQWGLPDPDKMVMQGLGPNVLQGQKYAMNKGAPMPAATHVGGMPLLEKIEGGEQGGIMGLKSHGDITPAFLEPGEFVFTKKATDNVGAKRLYKLMQQAEQMGMR